MKTLQCHKSSGNRSEILKLKNVFSILIIFLLTIIFIPDPANADIVGVSSPAVDLNLIKVYADVTWAEISSNSMTLNGFVVKGGNAITWNSDNLLFYAIVQTDEPARRLVTVDPSTGVCTDIGEMDGGYSSLTYSSTTGTLYAMGGAGGGAISQRLYSVNITTAATTFLGGPYPVGTDGEVIAYNYDDGFIYHWSGNVTANMEKINTTTFVATPVPQTGVTHNEIFGAVYQGGGNFIATDINAKAIKITSAGVVSLQATIALYPPRGLGYVDQLLPVELTSFVSSVEANNVLLNWTTSSETNNSHFIIERKSIINSEWSVVGNVQGNGTTSSPQNYYYNDRNISSGNYGYRLKQIDFNGNFEYFNLSNEVVIGIPSKYDLSQNYPNPFNPSTKISFDLPVDGKVSLKIFDMSGKELMTLVNEVKTAGYYSVSFNASSLSSGVYFYSLSADNFTATKKMMLIK
ncbi:MAG TPA: T9SS type A sorting domain-containing protein [Ignavibacteria bacterium]|nr:T9SS type A sorting domain-containing protein [Ignavibacteria bacterium]